MIKQVIQKQLIKLCRECQSAMLQPPILRCCAPATAIGGKATISLTTDTGSSKTPTSLPANANSRTAVTATTANAENHGNASALVNANATDGKTPLFEIIKGGKPYPTHFARPRTVKRDTLQKVIAISDAYNLVGQPFCSKN